MKFTSTKGQADPLSFSDAALRGLAPDGGLYVPERFPQVDWRTYADVADDPAAFAARMLVPFFEGDRQAGRLSEICERALNFPIPLKSVDERVAILELFHGPTCAFKDVGARFLAECAAGREGAVIAATSGDTGGAVAAAFVGRENVEVLILYPKGKISARQEKQLTCWGGNVRAFAVRGAFDDCQRVAKEAMRDPELSQQTKFISANSISVGRLLPQATFHARASVLRALATGRAAGIAVPTGNLGDAVAALWAKAMGFPIGRVILATNANATIRDFFASGEMTPRASIATLANAMDVGDPSNMERLRALYPDFESLRRDVGAELATDSEISAKIAERPWGEILCPHTAAGAVAIARQPSGGDWILAATAHPAKFETIVEPLIGARVPIPPALEAILERPSSKREIEPTFESFRTALADRR